MAGCSPSWPPPASSSWTSRVRLLRGDTLEEVAVLPAPDNGTIHAMALDAQGRRLLMCLGSRSVAWNLEGIRERLVIETRTRSAAVKEAAAVLKLPLSAVVGLPDEPKATLKTGRVPVWEAYGRFLAQAKLSARPAGSGLSLGAVLGETRAAQAGPFRLGVESLAKIGHRSLDGGALERTLQVGLRLHGDPMARLPLVGPLRVREAIDDKGGLLTQAYPRPLAYSSPPDAAGTYRTFWLTNPEAGARRVKTLALALPVRVPLGRRRLARSPLPTPRSPGKLAKGKDGVSLAVSRAYPGPGSWTVDLYLLGPAGWTCDPARHDLFLVDATGKAFRASEPIPYSYRGRPARPGLGGLPWAAFAPGLLAADRRRQGPVRFRVPAGEKPVALVLEEADHAESEVLFTLRDIPLP